MLRAYTPVPGGVERHELAPGQPVPAKTVWLDLDHPDAAERAAIEAYLALKLPTPEEMQEIEPSSRLYVEDDAIYLTATFLAHADDPNPTASPITFILKRHILVTLRYTSPRPFETYAQRLMNVRSPVVCNSGEEALIGLIESVVDRIADILERVSNELDAMGRQIFDDRKSTQGRRTAERRDLRAVLRSLARSEDLTATARESLLGLMRLIRFFETSAQPNVGPEDRDHRERLRELTRDITTLGEHAGFELQKINFTLDATLGVINIEQNGIIKIFSVAAVVFLPPTLVASIYGMNFRNIPELDWVFGYPMALGLMVLSAIGPYFYFKRRGWL